ncbi:hypothetical protein M9978_16695 [Sphingomonas sp. MG17]|uniref:Uncharacterized protein n=1 Tax=Sphingomonas tagetis TaxID=2949092 RepID=A0A9X2HR46_9SPHN|nr:hypothetical protein [Sphingomonas tagetis]MCP3732064.1 hypothetical protein [Sphingomonas tagetis]
MIGLAFLLMLQAASPATQDLPRSHREGAGPSTMCGITAADAKGLRAMVEADSRFIVGDGGSRFELFATPDQMIQWTFAKPGEAAFPSASCREVMRTADGSLSMKRDLRCDADRVACDKLALEYGDLDARLTRALQGKTE